MEPNENTIPETQDTESAADKADDGKLLEPTEEILDDISEAVYTAMVHAYNEKAAGHAIMRVHMMGIFAMAIAQIIHNDGEDEAVENVDNPLVMFAEVTQAHQTFVKIYSHAAASTLKAAMNRMMSEGDDHNTSDSSTEPEAGVEPAPAGDPSATEEPAAE